MKLVGEKESQKELEGSEIKPQRCRKSHNKEPSSRWQGLPSSVLGKQNETVTITQAYGIKMIFLPNHFSDWNLTVSYSVHNKVICCGLTGTRRPCHQL